MNKTQEKKNINLTPNCEGSSSIYFFVTNLNRFLPHSFNILYFHAFYSSFRITAFLTFFYDKTQHTRIEMGLKLVFSFFSFFLKLLFFFLKL